jgi:hypothetical protein
MRAAIAHACPLEDSDVYRIGKDGVQIAAIDDLAKSLADGLP